MAERTGVLLQAVRTLTNDLNKMVDEGRRQYQSSPDINDFVLSRGSDKHHGLLLVYPVNLYVECLKTVGVKSRDELEALWASLYSDPAVSECVENLLAAEDRWVDFISELDREMEAHEERTALPIVQGGEQFPLDIPLIEPKTGDTVQLKSCFEKSKYTLFILRKHYV